MTASVRIANTIVRLVRGNIVDQEVDALVNAANSTLLGGGGVDGAIHSRGGPAILEACKALRASTHPQGLPAGEAVMTTAGKLRARRVVHTVGPIWRGGGAGEARVLAHAYRAALRLAAEEGMRSVAFPSISTGAYGYPTAAAARVALTAVTEEIAARPDAFTEVRFALFSREDFEIYNETLQEVCPSGDRREDVAR